MLKGILMKDIRNLACRYHYKIMNTYIIGERTIKHYIPYTTGYHSSDFPKYLVGFEHCYEKRQDCWQLKHEYYYDKRPEYTFTMQNRVYDVMLTPKGKTDVIERFHYHKRLMEEYQRLMEMDKE